MTDAGQYSGQEKSHWCTVVVSILNFTMRPQILLMLGLTGVTVGQYPQRDIDSGLALRDLSRQSHDAALARLRSSTSGCTPQTIRVRKEW